MNWWNWVKWIAIYLVSGVIVGASYLTLNNAIDSESARQIVFRWIFGVAGAVWLCLAGRGMYLLSQHHRSLAKWIAIYFVGVVLLQSAGAFIWSVSGWMPAASTIGRAVGGAWTLFWAFIILLALVRLALQLRWQPLAVARTVLDEAVDLKIVVILVALLLLILPMLPFVITADQPLRYRIQNFLHYSMFISGVLLSLMTVFLACWTLANEVAERQIHTISVKPIGRGAYLFGKWLGIMLLNAVLLTIVAAAIYGFTMFHLATLEPYDHRDPTAIRLGSIS